MSSDASLTSTSHQPDGGMSPTTGASGHVSWQLRVRRPHQLFEHTEQRDVGPLHHAKHMRRQYSVELGVYRFEHLHRSLERLDRCLPRRRQLAALCVLPGYLFDNHEHIFRKVLPVLCSRVFYSSSVPYVLWRLDHRRRNESRNRPV